MSRHRIDVSSDISAQDVTQVTFMELIRYVEDLNTPFNK